MKTSKTSSQKQLTTLFPGDNTVFPASHSVSSHRPARDLGQFEFPLLQAPHRNSIMQ